MMPSDLPVGDAECPTKLLEGDLRVMAADLDSIPLYTHVTGSVGVQDVEGIVDLSFLRCLRSVKGQLTVMNSGDIVTLAGLERLETVGALTVQYNPSLVSLAALERLEIIEDWALMSDNESLRNLDFPALREVSALTVGLIGPTLEDPLVCASGDRSAIEGVDGFAHLETFDEINLMGLRQLASLEGFVGIGARVKPSERNPDPRLGVGLMLNESLDKTLIDAVFSEPGAEQITVGTCGNLGEATLCECPGAG